MILSSCFVFQPFCFEANVSMTSVFKKASSAANMTSGLGKGLTGVFNKPQFGTKGQTGSSVIPEGMPLVSQGMKVTGNAGSSLMNRNTPPSMDPKNLPTKVDTAYFNNNSDSSLIGAPKNFPQNNSSLQNQVAPTEQQLPTGSPQSETMGSSFMLDGAKKMWSTNPVLSQEQVSSQLLNSSGVFPNDFSSLPNDDFSNEASDDRFEIVPPEDTDSAPIQQAIQTLTDQKGEWDRLQKQLTQQLDSMRKDNESLNQNLKQLSTENETLTQQINGLQDENSKLGTANETLRTDLEKQNQNNQELQNTIQEINQHNEESLVQLQTQCDEKDKSIQELSEQLTQVKDEAAKQTEQITSLAQANQEYERLNNALTQENQGLKEGQQGLMSVIHI